MRSQLAVLIWMPFLREGRIDSLQIVATRDSRFSGNHTVLMLIVVETLFRPWSAPSYPHAARVVWSDTISLPHPL